MQDTARSDDRSYVLALLGFLRLGFSRGRKNFSPGKKWAARNFPPLYFGGLCRGSTGRGVKGFGVLSSSMSSETSARILWEADNRFDSLGEFQQ